MATPSRAMYSTGRSHAADNIQHTVMGVRVVRVMPACGCGFIQHKGWGLGSTERKLAEDLKMESSKLAETLNRNKKVLHSRTDARHNLPPACGGGGSVADCLLRQRALDSKPEQHNTHIHNNMHLHPIAFESRHIPKELSCSERRRRRRKREQQPTTCAHTAGYLSFGTKENVFVTSACARRPGTATRVSLRLARLPRAA